MKVFPWLSTIIVLALLVAACTPLNSGGTPGTKQTPATDPSPLTCPFDIQVAIQGDSNCQTPHSLRVAYGVESLMQRGYTGKGQTIGDIVSYGDPSLRKRYRCFAAWLIRKRSLPSNDHKKLYRGKEGYKHSG